MNPDGYDDVRLLLHQADAGPLPDLDVEELLLAGSRLRRRGARDRWLAAAAAVLVVGAAAVTVVQIGRGEGTSPADPRPSEPSRSTFVPTPTTGAQWLLYAQVAADRASSVHVVQELAPDSPTVRATVDAVLGTSSAQGSVTSGDVTSRYISVGGATYVEPAVLVKLGLLRAGGAGGATWVRLGPESRFRVPSSVAGAVSLADAGRWGPTEPQSGQVDGRPAVVVPVDLSEILPPFKLQTYYVDQASPYYPLLITRDGRDIARLTDWNAPVTTPVAPPAAEVTTVPGL